MKKIRMLSVTNYFILLLSCIISFYACKKQQGDNVISPSEGSTDYSKLFKELRAIKPNTNSVSEKELNQLADDMIEVEPSEEKQVATLRKLYSLNTSDMEKLYSLIGKRNLEIAEAEGHDVSKDKEEFVRLDKLIKELNQKSLNKYGKDFYRISCELQDELLQLTNKDMEDAKVQEWCAYEDYPRKLYKQSSAYKYSATSVSHTRTSWTDIATGCDYKVSFSLYGTGWHGTTTSMVNAIYTYYNGALSAQSTPSHMVVGRKINFAWIGDATLKSELKLTRILL